MDWYLASLILGTIAAAAAIEATVEWQMRRGHYRG